MTDRNFTTLEWKEYDDYVESRKQHILDKGLDVMDVYHAALENVADVDRSEMLVVAKATVDYYIELGFDEQL